MNTRFRYTLGSGLLLLLAACGGGSGGGDDLPTGPVDLDDKADGLRQLGVVLSGPIAAFVELPTDTDAARAKSGSEPWSNPWGKPPRAKAIVEDCDEGSIRYEEGSGPRDFSLLNPVARNVQVSYERQTDNACKYIGQEGSLRYTYYTNGVAESGASGALQNGQYEYILFGSRGAPLIDLAQEHFGNQLTFEERTEATARLERLVRANDTLYGIDVLTRASRFSDGLRVNPVFVIGDRARAFHARVASDDSWFMLDGVFAYGSDVDGCRGGKMNLSTPSAGGVAFASGRPVGGELRIESGSTVALYSFNPGGATLTLNGGPGIVLTAEEVQATLADPEYCGP